MSGAVLPYRCRTLQWRRANRRVWRTTGTPTVDSMGTGIVFACLVCGVAYVLVTRRRRQLTAVLVDPLGG